MGPSRRTLYRVRDSRSKVSKVAFKKWLSFNQGWRFPFLSLHVVRLFYYLLASLSTWKIRFQFYERQKHWVQCFISQKTDSIDDICLTNHSRHTWATAEKKNATPFIFFIFSSHSSRFWHMFSHRSSQDIPSWLL